jgi:hypothetical protein
MQEQEQAGLPGQGSVIRYISLGYGQRLYPRHRNQLKGHVPIIKERTFPSMGEDDDDRVHSGGLPTTTVLRTILTATVEWSRSRKYKVQGWHVASRAVKGKSRIGGLVILSYLECSICHLLLGDRCNPRHHYIRWPRDP